MTTDARALWDRYRTLLVDAPDLGFRLDVSRMGLDDAALAALEEPMGRAFREMSALEAGSVANPDEGRRVGHYWLRAPELAPEPGIAAAVRETVDRVERFAGEVHASGRFSRVLLVGIGGSALGPMFVGDALGSPADPMRLTVLDNTDPDGLDRTLGALAPELARTLVVVVSKSGGTPETRNGMKETEAAFRRAGLALGPQAVAVTQEGSALDAAAREQGFLARFPMWDWVGGRTSELSAVGLLPAALQGIDIRGLLRGAAAMDALTRVPDLRRNPAALLAAAWHHAGNGRGERAMVVLPYRDRLALFSRYLQQLVMESLGKEKDLAGRTVHQGLAVYGNKGSTDQHAYVQQLRDGRADFFVTFLEVLSDRPGPEVEVEPGVTSGDYLQGFLLGTRRALHEAGRPSLTVTLRAIEPPSVGALIALYERAVGLYAFLVGINAYHQPGVEAGKKAAAAVLDLQRRALAALRARGPRGGTADEIAAEAGSPGEAETVFHLLERLSANPGRGVARAAGEGPTAAVYRPA